MKFEQKIKKLNVTGITCNARHIKISRNELCVRSPILHSVIMTKMKLDELLKHPKRCNLKKITI